MAIEQKLTLTQLDNEQSDAYRVRLLWTSTQTSPTYNNVSHIAYLYYSIDGGSENTVSVKYTLPALTEQTILDTVIEIPLSAEGTVTLNVRTWMNTYLTIGVIQLEDTLELKPLASTITANDAMIGAVSTVIIHRSGANHTHSVGYSIGEQSGYLTDDGGISAKEVLLTKDEILFQLPESFYKELIDGGHGVCTLSCTTYSGNSQIGEVQTATLIAYADESVCGPSVIGSVYDINEKTYALTGDDRTLIRYHSTAECTIAPEPKHHAHITKKWINSTEVTGDRLEIPNIDQAHVLFAVEDSRGFQGEFVEPIYIIPYRHLSVMPQIVRDDPTSGNATLHYSGFFYNGSFGATGNDLVFEYKIDSGDFKPAEIDYATEGSKYSAKVTISDLDYRKVFTITARVSDKLETVEKKLTLKKGVPVFDWGENDFVFHVPVKVEGTLDAQVLSWNGVSLFNWIYPIGTIYTTCQSDADPNKLFGGAWEQVSNPSAIGYYWKRVS